MTNNAVPRDATDHFVESYGSTRVAALRQIYGNTFASGVDGRKTLAEVAVSLDPGLLERVARDHDQNASHDESPPRRR